MNTASWNRWLALAGVLSGILLVVGLVLVSVIDNSESDATLLKDTLDSGNQTATVAGAYVLAVAAVMLLCFGARLRSYLGAAEGGRETLAGLAFAATAVCAALVMVSGILIATIAGAVIFGSAPDPQNVDVVRFVPQAGFGVLFIGGMFAAIAMILSTSIITLRTGVLPAWFGWLGIVVSIALIFAAPLFFPAVALPVWLIVGGVLMMGRTEDRPPAA
jgi:hypothetical protein